MTHSEATTIDERRVRVVGDRVACWRLGSVQLVRCRECLYLVRMEEGGPKGPPHVVCTAVLPDDEIDFAW
jgi:hypothetical protein